MPNPKLHPLLQRGNAVIPTVHPRMRYTADAVLQVSLPATERPTQPLPPWLSCISCVSVSGIDTSVATFDLHDAALADAIEALAAHEPLSQLLTSTVDTASRDTAEPLRREIAPQTTSPAAILALSDWWTAPGIVNTYPVRTRFY